MCQGGSGEGLGFINLGGEGGGGGGRGGWRGVRYEKFHQ